MNCPNCGVDLAADMSCARCRQFGAAPDPSPNGHPWRGRFAKAGAGGVAAWKFKTVLLLALTKGKLLLLGLMKMSTLFSMLAMFGTYWIAYGWAFAAGLVLSIYVHEMGHVAALRKYNIAATAPMFIPFFGAFVRMKQYPANVIEDARVGLAGPIYGLCAAVFAWIMGLLTGAPIWFAIARVGAWINLLNLIPIWQLDGGRGFRALSRKQRGVALVIVLLMWAVTEEVMLLFLALGAACRLFTKDAPEQPDNLTLMQYGGLIVFLSGLFVLSINFNG